MIDYKKRFKAYLVDIIILVLILTIVSFIVPENQDNKILNNEIVELNESLVRNDISFSQYYNHFSLIAKDLDSNNTTLTLINIFFVIMYFVVYPSFTDGKTIGQRKMKIQIVDFNDEIPSVRQLMIRNLIINGILYMLITLSMLYIVSEEYYFTWVSILGIIQLIIVFYSAYMVIYSKDKKGLQDILSNTFFKG
jgi:uncharacterized RDD family membrane protein YckC